MGSQSPTWAQVGLAGAAALVLCWAGAVLPLALLAGAGIVTAWLEAPELRDQWLLVALVDVGILLCVLVGAARRRGTDRVDLAERLFPPARLCLVAVHAFAGFARLNDGFLDRRVSCGVLRFRDTTASLGLEVLQLDGAAWLERAVILGTIGVLLAVPVLLVVHRTRWAGVMLALAFHGAVGLDRDVAFWDSSIVAVALLSLFVPSAGPWAAERIGSVRARLDLRGPRMAPGLRLLLVGVALAAGLLVATDRISRDTAQDLGWWAWQAVLVVAVVSLVRIRRQVSVAPRVALVPHHVLFAAIPLLVVISGVAPYVGLKTADSWTDWSNLRAVAGETNHLVVSSTGSLAGADAEVVRIVDTDDPALATYRSHALGLTWRDLRAYLSEHPSAAVTYVREGRRVAVASAGERPELVEPVPTWEAKLLPFRPADLIQPERCLSDRSP